jgi:hypothetical protein
VKARRNPLYKIEEGIGRILQWPFTFLPSKLQPAEVIQKLKQTMEDNVQLLGEGRRLAPNVYDIYLSIRDHQQLAPGEDILKRDWQDQLVQFARQRHYTLRSVPILRLHASSDVHGGTVRVEAELLDRQHMGANGEGGIMATQALSAEQLAQLRAQLPQGQQLPGLTGPSAPYAGQPGLPGGPLGSSSMHGSVSSLQNNLSASALSALPAMPQAWLTIRLPAVSQNAPAAPKVYRIEKPVINIGRQLTNDIIVEDKRVSRYHAQIKFQPNGQFIIFDLGSTNGINVNGTPSLRQHTLHHGDHFIIGSYDFYFERR